MCGLPLASTQGLRASYPLLGAAPIRGEAGQRPPRGLPTYVFECGVCGKRFRRKKNDGRLNPHKSKQGWPCTGRTGYLVDVKY